MNKRVTFGARPEREASTTAATDAWVNNQSAAAIIEAPQPREKEATKRLTIDVSADLHRRIKVQCAVQGVNIADALRELLEQRFPEQQNG